MYINTYSGVIHVESKRRLGDIHKRQHQKYRRLDDTYRMAHPYCRGDKIAMCGQVLSTAYRRMTGPTKRKTKVCQHCVAALKKGTTTQQELLLQDVMR